MQNILIMGQRSPSGIPGIDLSSIPIPDVRLHVNIVMPVLSGGL